jgi:hypothetical protein
MGILDKIKDEAEKLMQRQPGDNVEPTGGSMREETPADDMQTAQNTVRPQGGAPDPDMDQAGSMDMSQDTGTGTGQDTGMSQNPDMTQDPGTSQDASPDQHTN